MSTPTKTEHTPGPWHVNTLEVVPLSIHAAHGHVATVSTGSMGECELEECEANARLIAAAPEMIHALELAHVALARRGCGCDCENMPAPCVMCAVETAIAKAKGGAV